METLFGQTRDLLHKITEVLCYFRCQRDAEACEMTERVISMGQTYIENLEKDGFINEAENLHAIMKSVSEMAKIQSGMQISNLLRKELTPILYQLQGSVFGQSEDILRDCWEKNSLILRKKNGGLYRDICSVKTNISDEYQLGWARTGDLVLSVRTERGTIRLNSSGDPWREAFLFAVGELEKKDYEECVLFGFGMGYHVEALVRESNAKRIVVLETDVTQLAIALSYRDLSDVLSDSRVSVLCFSNPRKYSDWLKTEKDRLSSLWYPSIKAVRGKAFREILENYWIENASVKALGDILEENFQSNVKRDDKEVSVLKEVFYKKTMLLIAAGPSLEENIEELKNLDCSKYVVVCVGKVAKKLIEWEVYPDYIVMIDGKAGTAWQIKGIEDCMVPLIYLSTAAANVVEAYQGKKYIAFQEGFLSAEKFADKKGYSLYQTGGSVSTFALDMGIRMGCSCIVCLGLDLGYLDERSHAFGIGASVSNSRSLRKVEGIASDYVYTSRTLDIYRRWIEKRIQREKAVTFINISKGARIHGMEEKEFYAL